MPSSSMCGTASRAARALASVDLPDPEFPTTDTRLMTGPAYLGAIRHRSIVERDAAGTARLTARWGRPPRTDGIPLFPALTVDTGAKRREALARGVLSTKRQTGQAP